jgi:hypothetical protein
MRRRGCNTDTRFFFLTAGAAALDASIADLVASQLGQGSDLGWLNATVHVPGLSALTLEVLLDNATQVKQAACCTVNN